MQVTIERLGHLGDGIAPGPVFVARTLPGEVVEGEVVDGRIAAPRIVTPSPDRVSAPCPHYRGCGGCALMHARDDFVADWKAGVVRAALDAQRLAAPITGVQTSPPRSRRRATFSGRRFKSGPVVGFHGRSSGAVVAIPDCRLLHPGLIAVIPALRALTGALGSRRGEMRFAATLSEGGPDIDIASDVGGRDADALLAEWAEEFDLARVSLRREVAIERRRPFIRIAGVAVTPPPGAFQQATAEGEAALQAAVLRAVGPARRVADLFSGCGTFSLPLLRHAPVHAVEGDRAMLDALDRGWRHGEGLRKLTVEARDLFRRPLEPAELDAYDAVVIDPPRAGAEAQVRALSASRVATVAAISCNPVTFARDARILADGGYRLEWVEVIDQFRWSPHVELAARFTHAPQ